MTTSTSYSKDGDGDCFCTVDEVLEFLDSVSLEKEKADNHSNGLSELSIDVEVIAEFLNSTNQSEHREVTNSSSSALTWNSEIETGTPKVVSARKTRKNQRRSPLIGMDNQKACPNLSTQHSWSNSSEQPPALPDKTGRRVKLLKFASNPTTPLETESHVHVIRPVVSPLETLPSIEALENYSPPVFTIRKKHCKLPEDSEPFPINMQSLDSQQINSNFDGDISSRFQALPSSAAPQLESATVYNRKARRVKKPITRTKTKYSKEQMLHFASDERCLLPPPHPICEEIVEFIRYGEKVNPDSCPVKIIQRCFFNEKSIPDQHYQTPN